MAYYCLHELHRFPSEYASLPWRERAFIIAACEVRAQDRKRQQKVAKRQRR